MLHYLWLIPALPLAGFLILGLLGARLPNKLVAIAGAGSVGLSALTTILLGIQFIHRLPEQTSFNQSLWSWMNLPGYKLIQLHTFKP